MNNTIEEQLKKRSIPWSTLSKDLDLNRVTLWRWKNKRPMSKKHLQILKQYFNCETKDLLTF